MIWLRQIFARRRLSMDLSQEIQQHLDEKVEELVAEGIRSRENAVSLAVSVDEIHDPSNFSQRAGFEPVFSHNLFEPILHFERMHGESTFLLPFRKHPTI